MSALTLVCGDVLFFLWTRVLATRLQRLRVCAAQLGVRGEEPDFAGGAADDMMAAIAGEAALGALGGDDDEETFGGPTLSVSLWLVSRSASGRWAGCHSILPLNCTAEYLLLRQSIVYPSAPVVCCG